MFPIKMIAEVEFDFIVWYSNFTIGRVLRFAHSLHSIFRAHIALMCPFSLIRQQY